MTSLPQRLQDLVHEFPDRIAATGGGSSMTYRELWQRARMLASHWNVTFGASKAPVALLGHKQAEMLVGMVGAMLSGRAYIPLDVMLPQARQDQILRVAQPAALLKPEEINALTAGWESLSGDAKLPACSRDDAFYIIFTSGSTGDPKGVVITHGNLATFLDWMLKEQALQRGGETFFNQAPLSFDLSVMDTHVGLFSGSTVVYSTKDDVANPRELYAKLHASKATVWVSTPSFAQMCLAEKTLDATMMPHLRRFLFCGETLAHRTAATLVQRFPDAEIWNTYGPTEATVATTSVRVTPAIIEQHNPLPIGYAMPGVRVEIRREDGSHADDGEHGEIFIFGDNVSPGYLGRADLTEKAFVTENGVRGYRTGDKGFHKDGLLFFLGRLDFQVKVRGHRIELGDVEAHVREAPGVIEAVVLPLERNGVCDSLAAFVVTREPVVPNDAQAARALRENVAQRIPDYMVPRKVIFLDTLPMNTNGKADRHELLKRLKP